MRSSNEAQNSGTSREGSETDKKKIIISIIPTFSLNISYFTVFHSNLLGRLYTFRISRVFRKYFRETHHEI